MRANLLVMTPLRNSSAEECRAEARLYKSDAIASTRRTAGKKERMDVIT
jgi:hypothetical protein